MLPEEAFSLIEQRLLAMAKDRTSDAPRWLVELGSGYGTERLMTSAGSAGVAVVSVEHDPKFVGLVPDARYIYAPIRAGWYDARTLGRRLPPKEDIVALVIDGPPSKIGRGPVMQHLHLFPPDVPILIDDVHRPVELELARRIAKARGADVAPTIHRCAGGERAFATIGAW
jgi:hypothetical protein